MFVGLGGKQDTGYVAHQAFGNRFRSGSFCVQHVYPEHAGRGETFRNGFPCGDVIQRLPAVDVADLDGNLLPAHLVAVFVEFLCHLAKPAVRSAARLLRGGVNLGVQAGFCLHHDFTGVDVRQLVGFILGRVVLDWGFDRGSGLRVNLVYHLGETLFGAFF